MPRTINYRPTIIDELITNERLDSYKNVFEYSDDAELVGAYIWNTHVCAAIYPLLTTAEVSLRNAIDNALVNALGNFWWSRNRLHYNSFVPNQTPPFAVDAIKKNFSKATLKVKKDKRSRYGINQAVPAHHEVISNTEFSTWEFILDSEFMGNGLIWPAHLGSVFQGQWPTQRSSTMLSTTKDLVKVVREFRNRVSHSEPVWKRYGVQTEYDAILHLNEKIGKITDLIELISPQKLDLITKSGLLNNAKRACSLNELRRFQHNYETHKIKSISKLCKLAQKATQENANHHIMVYKYRKLRFILQPI